MKNIQTTIDKTAISFSVICAIHCLLVPIAITLLPVLAATPLEGEVFHKLLLIGVLPASIVGLTLGCKKHKKWNNVVLGGIGLSALVFAAFFGHDLTGELGEKVITVIGAILISWSHLRNHKLCSLNKCQH